MIKVGLTGTIGSGKSTVALIFGTLGVPVYYADQQARELLLNEEVKMKLRKMFGPAIFDESGQVQRAKMAEKVFNNPSDLQALNNLIHPLVKIDFDAWLKKYATSAYIIHEAAILFESGFNRYFDKVIVVDAPLEICISRVMQRDGVTRDKVENRMQHQWNREQKKALADYIIVNDGENMVLPQVIALHAKLKAFALKA
ncbi:MAG TPA: dephospho-CoA kinase [Bacteroidales bacterium]